MALPSLIAIKSYANGKYLGCDTKIHEYLLRHSFSLLDPAAKFAVEHAMCGGGLVHIRSCSSNKYWVRGYDDYIVGGAIKKVEDKSAKNCTLFRPSFVTIKGRPIYKFTHVQTGMIVCLIKKNKYALSISDESQWEPNPCELVDLESLVVLPKRAAFKGDNDKYLGANWYNGKTYQQFETTDIASKLIVQEVYQNEDGYVRFKNTNAGKFWRRSPDWICAESDDTSFKDKDTLFWPVKVDDGNFIALRNIGNNNFCRRATGYVGNSLNANTGIITREAWLQVTDHVLSRRVNVMTFRVEDARIYGESPLIVAQQSAVNNSGNTNQMTLSFSYTNTIESCWSNSISVTLGISTTLETGVPFIAEGKIEVSAEVSDTYEWGSTRTESEQLTPSYTVTVPPWTTANVSLVATKATCDIPFAYEQVDHFYDGTTNKTTLYDGVYKGINAFNFYFKNDEEPIPPPLRKKK